MVRRGRSADPADSADPAGIYPCCGTLQGERTHPLRMAGIVSRIIHNRARYEARNRYNPKAPEWQQQPEAKVAGAQMRAMWHSQKGSYVMCPWAEAALLR